MAFEIPSLKYAENALEPHISKETIGFHYGKHMKKYYDTVNELIKGTVYESRKELIDLINKDTMLRMESKLFNNACQAWNHQFYFSALCPTNQSGKPSETLLAAINEEFESLDQLIKKLSDMSVKIWCSGYGWLVWKEDKLIIKTTSNGANPLTDKGQIPLLCIDVFEHAYYLDHANERETYVKAIWNIIDWSVVSERYETAIKKGTM